MQLFLYLIFVILRSVLCDEGPMQFAGTIAAGGKCRGPFDKLRAGSSARRVAQPLVYWY
jgi:hypothetical protein